MNPTTNGTEQQLPAKMSAAQPVNGASKTPQQTQDNPGDPEIVPRNSAEDASVEVVLASPQDRDMPVHRSAFMPAMTMEVALARRAAIVEFVKRLMVRDQDFGDRKSVV